MNAQQNGTKATAHYVYTVPAQGQVEVRVRLAKAAYPQPFTDFADLMQQRRDETDAFYAGIQTGLTDDENRLIQRQALAGMIWSKQFYY